MTEEQIKQKADDYIITRQNHIKYFSGEAVKILLKNFAEEIVTEVTQELKKENAELRKEWQEQVQKATDEGFARTQLQIENGKLKEQIEKMKDCSNCKYRYIQDNADLGEGERTDPCLACRSHNMWELAE